MIAIIKIDDFTAKEIGADEDFIYMSLEEGLKAKGIYYPACMSDIEVMCVKDFKLE